jgi:hypothetical protein
VTWNLRLGYGGERAARRSGRKIGPLSARMRSLAPSTLGSSTDNIALLGVAIHKCWSTQALERDPEKWIPVSGKIMLG